MKSDYWWYKSYLLQLKQHNRKLADSMEKLWDRQDTPLKTRNYKLRYLLKNEEKRNEQKTD